MIKQWCTNNLAIAVLEKSVAISRIISQWGNGLNGQQLIDQWKVHICTEEDKEADYHEDEKLRLITINVSNVTSSRKCIAEKIFQKR